jgi:hypothetical protein
MERECSNSANVLEYFANKLSLQFPVGGNTKTLSDQLQSYCEEKFNQTRLTIGFVGDKSLENLDYLLEATMENYSAENPRKLSVQDQILTLCLDERFSVDWESENRRKQQIQNPDPIPNPKNPNKTFLVSNLDNKFNRYCTIEYGSIPEILVSFRPASEFPQPLFVAPAFKSLLGKQIRFCGKGENSDLDRIYIRDKLEELLCKYGVYTDKIRIGFPSSLLKRNRREIVICQGSDSMYSLEFAKKFVGVNCLVCSVSHESHLSNSVKGFLTSSGYLLKFSRNPKEFPILLLLQSNRLEFSGSEQKFDATLYEKKSMLNEQFLRLTKEHGVAPYVLSLQQTNHIQYFQVNFLEYLRELWKEPHSSFCGSQESGVTNFIFTFDHITLRKSTDSLQIFLDDWFKDHPLRLDDQIPSLQHFHDPQTIFVNSESQSNSSEICVEVEIQLLKEKFQNAKQEFQAGLEKLGSSLVEQAHHSVEYASAGWKEFRDNFMQSLENCRVLLSPRFGGECLGTSVNLFTCHYLLQFVPKVWKFEVLPRLSQQMQQITQVASELFRQCSQNSEPNRFSSCSSSLENSKDYSSNVKNSPILEFCHVIQQRTQNKVNLLNHTLLASDPDRLVRQVCENVVQQKILLPQDEQPNNLGDYHQLVEAQLANIPIEAASLIRSQLCKILETSLEQLSSLEQELIQETGKLLFQIKLQNLGSRKSTSVKQNQPDSIKNFLKNPNWLNFSYKRSGEFSDEAHWNLLGFLPQSQVKSFSFDSEKSFSDFIENLSRFGLFVHSYQNPTTENLQRNLFRLFSKLLFGTEELSGLIRVILVRELLQYFFEYSELLRINQREMNLSAYIVQYANSEFLGDWMSLISFANAFSVHFLIFTPICSSPILIKSRDESQQSRIKLLLYWINEEFQLLDTKSIPAESKPNSNSNFLKKRFEPEPSSLHESNPAPKRNKSEEMEILRPIQRIRVSRIGLGSLEEICLDYIVNHHHLLPKLEGQIPSGLIEKLFREYKNAGALTSVILNNLLQGSQISRVDLSYYQHFSSNHFQVLSTTIGENLLSLNLAFCSQIPCEGLIELCKRTNLQELNLRHSSWKDAQFLTQLPGVLSKVQRLNFHGTSQISDEFLRGIFTHCGDLQELCLSDCPGISRNAFSGVQTRGKIKKLHLSGLGIDAAWLQDIRVGFSESLEEIRFLARGISAENLFEFLNDCRSVVRLEMNQWVPSGNIESLIKLSQISSRLTQFEIRSSINCVIPGEWKEILCKELGNGNRWMFSGIFALVQNLDLSGCWNVDDGVLNSLRLPLRGLNLSGCDQISNVGLMSVVHQAGTNLELLDISKCVKISDEALICIANSSSNLQKLSVGFCVEISEFGLQAVLGNCKKLTHLNVASCIRSSNIQWNTLGNLVLERLNIEECDLVDDCLIQLARACPKLKSLRVGYSKSITGVGLAELISGCPNLSELDLSYCSQIQFSALQEFLPCARNLRCLWLRGWSSISNQGFSSHSLYSLDLSWCTGLEDSAVSGILARCRSLISLNLSRCPKISQLALVPLMNSSVPLVLRQLNIKGCNVPSAMGNLLARKRVVTVV